MFGKVYMIQSIKDKSKPELISGIPYSNGRYPLNFGTIVFSNPYHEKGNVHYIYSDCLVTETKTGIEEIFLINTNPPSGINEDYLLVIVPRSCKIKTSRGVQKVTGTETDGIFKMRKGNTIEVFYALHKSEVYCVTESDEKLLLAKKK